MNTAIRHIVAFIAAISMAGMALAADGGHKVAIHVDQNDPAVMSLALNNANNVYAYYKTKGEAVTVELVTYGPGLNMFIADKSPVKDRISAMSLEHPDMQFSACGNTLAAMTKQTGEEPKLISEAKIVPAGVIRLMELQEQGYAYIKP